MQRTDKIKLVYTLAAILILTVVLVFIQSRTFKRLLPLLVGGRVIEENLVIPELKSATGVDGRLMTSSEYLTPLVPKSADERLVIPLAKLTLKQGLEVARLNAGYWAGDVKLVYAKSLGAVTLEGKSSQWLYVFGSAKKHSSLGVVVREKEVVANLELSSDDYGYELPSDWPDVREAISSLANSPDFVDRSIGGLALYYNEDSDTWSFGVALDKGQSTSVPLK